MTMTAGFITAPGPADSIRVGQLPVPEPAADEVLVRVHASVVDHVDTFVRSGAFATPMTFPFVIGRDLVGTVERSAGGFAAGERVWCNSMGHGGRQGSFAQYAAVPAERLYPLPHGVDSIEAVSVLHTAATAWLGLVRHARLEHGETVVIGGAAGGVGTNAIEIAGSRGARIIATASESDAQWCRARGAHTVLDYRRADLYEAIASAAPGGVDVYWDTSGHHDLDATVALLARRGRIVLAAGLSARPPLPVGPLYTRDASLLGFAISNASVADLRDASVEINELLAHGALHSRVAAVVPLAEAARAHQLQEDPGVHGRVLVVI